jgi:hypothetical protein
MKRFTLSREMQIPKGSTKVADKQSDAVAYLYVSGNGKPAALIFFGKSDKPVSRYYWPNEARRDQTVKDAFERRRAFTAHKAGQRATRKAWVNPYKVGDLFRRSWGYDQTNIDWYEVVKVTGKMLWVREIAQECVATGDMTGRTTPQPGQYLKGDPKKCLAQDGCIKINHYAHAYFVKPQMIAGVPVYGTDRYSTYA